MRHSGLFQPTMQSLFKNANSHSEGTATQNTALTQMDLLYRLSQTPMLLPASSFYKREHSIVKTTDSPSLQPKAPQATPGIVK